MSAKQEARDEAVRLWSALDKSMRGPDSIDAFLTGATWQAARDAETIAGLKDEVERLAQKIVSDRSTLILETENASRAIQRARIERARADIAEARVRAVEGACAQVASMPIPADPGMSQTEITGRIVATITRVIRAALATPEPTVQTADYGPMGDPAHETGPDETYCRVCKRLALEHLPSEWSPYGTCPTQAWPQEDS